jgi:hypothetical protein
MSAMTAGIPILSAGERGGERGLSMDPDKPPPLEEKARGTAAEGVGEDAAAAVPVPVEEGARGAAAEGVGEDAAAAMPIPMADEEAFTGSPEPVPPEEVERRIEESKSRIEKSSSEESGQESGSSSGSRRGSGSSGS